MQKDLTSGTTSILTQHPAPLQQFLFPQWAFSGGQEGFAQVVNNQELQPQLKSDMAKIFQTERTGNDLRRVQFRMLPSDPSYNGKNHGRFGC
jgi:hypothetical protein